MKKLTLLLMLIFLYACSEQPDNTPEQQIRQLLEDIEQGIEDRSLTQVIEHIDGDYKDHHGRTKKDIKRYIQLQILRNQSITILSRIKSINVEGDFASVEMSTASGARGIDLNIESNRLKANTHKISIALKKKDGEWQITSSNWQQGW